MIQLWYRYIHPIVVVGRNLQSVVKENYEMLMPKELKGEPVESNDILRDPFPSSSSDVDSCAKSMSSKLTVKADTMSSSLYSVSIGSPRPELVCKLVISERFLKVAAPSPVFLSSSANILYSFSDSRFVLRSLMYFANIGVISTSATIQMKDYRG